ncbi:cation diffusion facilitator family transporter [Methanobacterium alcaliphilum]|uniref:cation diffusion facilitator family transporter n=1 Tax=Methanobacterium alcaliphilum TaxID=392018 RepID=UPI00200A3496|nr:cation diffusion facilitator family transporter [Methanobacterium alcaliphilum]MCK9151531.1 cation diffusion facilitator family transporter [Methanobacterium alcaliphilum]
MDNNSVNSLKKGEKAAKYSAYTNLILAVIKGIVGILAGSVALVADSIHSFSDIFSSLAVYVGLKISQKKPDQKFPYGYYKVETLVSLIISVLIVITGFEIAFESFNDFLNPSTIEFPIVSLLTAILSVVVSYYLAKYKEKIGKEIGSQALLNDGKHSMVDVFSSLIVFLGIFASYIGYVSIQGISGLMVSFLIIYIGAKLGKNDILVLLDAAIDPEKVELIKKTALSIEGVVGLHDIKIRRSGPYIFVEIHLELKRGESVKKARDITIQVEKNIKNQIHELDHIIIQSEPVQKNYQMIAVPLIDDQGLSSKITPHFGKAKFFIIAKVKGGTIESFMIKKNPAISSETKKGIKAAELLKEENVDVLVIEHLSEGPKYVLSDYLLGTSNVNGDNLEEIILNAFNSFEN